MIKMNNNTIRMLIQATEPAPAYGVVIPPNTSYRYKGLPYQTREHSQFIVTRCPYCRQMHMHGSNIIGPDGLEVDTRQSHCEGSGREKDEQKRDVYRLVALEGDELRKDLKKLGVE